MASGLWPQLCTPMPTVKSRNTLPSTSLMNGPSATSSAVGSPIRIPSVTHFSFRASIFFDLGPGGSTTILGPLSFHFLLVFMISHSSLQ